MGRQAKIGLDFWLRDVRLFRDPKLRAPRQKYGYLAPYIYECLLDILYSDKGYYIDYRGEEKDNVLWQLTECTQGRYAPTMETLAGVVDCLTASGLFSGDLYKQGFITSKRAQRNYFSATLCRSAVRINFDIWLLSEEEMRELNPSGKSLVLQSFIVWREKGVSGQEKRISRSESTQSREEQKREEQRRAEQIEAALLIDELEQLLGFSLDQTFRLELTRLMEEGMQKQVLLYAAEKALRSARDVPAYFRVLLRSYEQDGIWQESDLAMSGGGRKEKPTLTQRLRIDQKEPQGELEDWEKQWLEQIRQHESRRERNGES